MPRPKVPVQNRKRALQACTHCRNSKKRCNGQHPCANCVRKNLAPSCVFEDVQPASSVDTPLRRRSEAYSSTQTSPGAALARSVGSQIRSPATTTITTTTTATGAVISSPEIFHRSRLHSLDNARGGEKVFFGGSASLAFLQLIRDAVSQNVGRSGSSQDAGTGHILEVPHAPAPPIIDVPLSRVQERSFLDAAFVATQGVVEVCTKDYIINLLETHRAGAHVKALELAIARTTLAIGAQCSEINSNNSVVSKSYFAQAQKQAFAGMIEDPSLEMVQLFLLMAFYMLGACHRNAGYIYVGVAARAAYALGLHSIYADLRSVYEEDVRSRYDGGWQDLNRTDPRRKVTWHCLVALDTMISSIVGRPSATSTTSTVSIKITDDVRVDDETSQGRSAAMQASYQLASLLDQKVQELYNSDKVTAEAARVCLDQLSGWSSRLPSELRLASNTIQNATVQGQVIGSLHVSCFYYFAVMLVSRPFLVVHLTNRLGKNRQSSDLMSSEYSEAGIEGEIQEIANACLSAALFLVQTCVETHTYGLLPANMRILKAWVFAAGLILGFEMFSTNQSDPEIEEAFRGSCDVLRALSPHSAQASHNLNLLTSLLDAITTRRRQAVSERKRSDRPIVDRIMAFEPPSQSGSQGSQPAADNDASQITSITPMTDDSSAVEGWFPGFATDTNFQEMLNEPFLNWENSDFLSWDPFSRDLPPQ